MAPIYTIGHYLIGRYISTNVLTGTIVDNSTTPTNIELNFTDMGTTIDIVCTATDVVKADYLIAKPELPKPKPIYNKHHYKSYKPKPVKWIKK